MPDNNVKKLYMAKSLKELNNFIDVKLETKPEAIRMCRSAVYLFKNAEDFRKDGDEEKSYVLYMRFISTVLQIRKQKPYQTDKNYFDGMFGKNNVTDAQNWASKLSSSLEKRYEMLKVEEEADKRLQMKALNTAKIENDEDDDDFDVVSIKDVDTKTIVNVSSIIPHNNDVSAVVGVDKDLKGSISCRTLYELLLDEKVNLLIMDTRTTEDYAASRISDEKCISVPADIITPGISGPKLGAVLPSSSLKLWNKRSEADVIVLMDWSSSVLNPPIGKEVETLKKAIFLYDTFTVLKCEPLVLLGGYEQWLNYYPTCTTNSHVQRPQTITGISTDLITLNFEYPDLDKAFIASPEDLSEESLNISVLKPNIVNDLQTNDKLIMDLKPKDFLSKSTFPNIDRTTKPKQNSHMASAQMINGDVDVKKRVDPGFDFNLSRSSKPSFDRGTKPKFGSSRWMNEEQNHSFKDVVNRDKEVTDAALQIERNTLKFELEIDKLRLQREKEAEEGMRIELQKKETLLLDKIREMDEERKQIGVEKDLIKDENEKLKQTIEELTKKKNDEETKWLKEDLRSIKEKEEEKLKVEKEVNRLRLERKKKEAADAAAATAASIKNKKTEVDHPSSRISPSNSPIIRRHHVGTHDFGDGVERSFAKLNTDESRSSRDSHLTRGLSRSQSFPNLAQVLDDEGSMLSDDNSVIEANSRSSNSSRSEFTTPLINRGAKPSSAEVFAASNRNLMPVFGGLGRGVTGLRNIGNSCYMNSIIQCLANTPPLAEYFITRAYKQDINRNLNNMKRNYPGELVEEFAAVLHALHYGQYRFISPKDFKNVIGRYKKAFANCEQQDAQELLMLLVDCLHEDLNKANKNKAKDLEREIQSLEDSNLPKEAIGRKAWEVENLRNDSIFVRLFQGQYVSTLTCCYCNKESVKFDTFSCLTLPIPSGINNCNLKDCLQLFSKEEMMTGSSKWKCPRCKEPRDAKKKLDIYRLPPILTIHLKRFSYEGVWRKKLETNVDFPVTGLDMSDNIRGPDKRPAYDLYAITNHYGMLEGGHYISFCKNLYYNKWFKYDDHEVQEISTSKIKSSAAYILFYSCHNAGSLGYD